MILSLEDFLDEKPDFTDMQWCENLGEIIDFLSTEECSAQSLQRESLLTAVLMKAFITNPDSFSQSGKTALLKGLERLSLMGDDFKDKTEAAEIFMKAGVREFIDLYPDFCPDFIKTGRQIISKLPECEKIRRYFSQRTVFVYGTLMKGEVNHHYLESSEYLKRGVIEGYEMYDVGSYPAVMPADGLITGELYRVPVSDMASIDMLEGEGTIYGKKCEIADDADGNSTICYLYVYLRNVEGLEKIPSWGREYLWYVSYGSNMLRERFMCYIKGGVYGCSRYRRPCGDTSGPLAVKTIEIPYDMYFANSSGSWNYCGVSFLDTTRKGKSLGVAYLITREQFVHITGQENGRRDARESCGWYDDIIHLGKMDGFDMMTFTNRELRPNNEPSEQYLDTLTMGIRQNWPEMSDEEIEEYLKSCIR